MEGGSAREIFQASLVERNHASHRPHPQELAVVRSAFGPQQGQREIPLGQGLQAPQVELVAALDVPRPRDRRDRIEALRQRTQGPRIHSGRRLGDRVRLGSAEMALRQVPGDTIVVEIGPRAVAKVQCGEHRRARDEQHGRGRGVQVVVSEQKVGHQACRDDGRDTGTARQATGPQQRRPGQGGERRPGQQPRGRHQSVLFRPGPVEQEPPRHGPAQGRAMERGAGGQDEPSSRRDDARDATRRGVRANGSETQARQQGRGKSHRDHHLGGIPEVRRSGHEPHEDAVNG